MSPATQPSGVPIGRFGERTGGRRPLTWRSWLGIVLVPALLGGMLLYWIDREWRNLDARHREPDNASARPDEKDEPDNVPTDQPPRI